MIEQAKFVYSPLGKAFEKQTKITEDQGIRQVKALKALKPEEELESIEELFPKNMRTDEIYEIKKWEEKIKRKDLKYEINKYEYDFQKHETIRYFCESIYAGKISLHEAEMDQTNLLENNKSTISLDQKQKKVRIKNEMLSIV